MTEGLRRVPVPRPPQSALFLERDPRHARRLSTGCARIDACLGGGFDAHGLTEIAGAAGTGKTQLVLQCMLQAQLPPAIGGLGGGAVFLHADTPSYLAPMKRLEELSHSFAAKHAALGATSGLLMSFVHVMQLHSADALWQTLKDTEWLRTKQVRLVVIDSVAGLFRTSDEEGGSRAAAAYERSRQLLRLAARLRQLSDAFDVAVLVVNQVTDKPLDTPAAASVSAAEAEACLSGGGDSLRVPALGLSWSSSVNTRLLLTRHERPAATEAPPLPPYATHPGAAPVAEEGGGGGLTFAREMHVLFSPRLPHSSCRFEVRAEGVVGVG
mmetsp:Transcript_11957/g.38044  ORF Transcript_11957/g.38044 Transcript_11957/m.38044 type:complete len:326 (-) Transcript_11957:271-1248(-)